MSNRKHRREIDKAVGNLIDFAERQDAWRERLDDAFSQFLRPLADTLRVDEQTLVDVFEESGFWPTVFGYVFEDFASASWDNEPRSMIEEYLQRRGWREAAYARRYLQAINDTEVRFWEIVSVKPGISVDVRPHGTESKAVRVTEKSASESLKQWDCLAARVVTMDGKRMFTGALLSFPPSEAERVYRVLAKARSDLIELYHDLLKEREIPKLPEDLEQLAEDEMEANLPDVLFRIWGAFVFNAVQNATPQLQNMDGEDFQMVTLRFPVRASQEDIQEKLDSLPDLERQGTETLWVWHSTDKDQAVKNTQTYVWGHLSLKGSSLELSVNSSERAERGKSLLSESLVDLVGEPLVIYDNIDHQMSEANPVGDGLDLNSTPEGQAIIKEYMDKHYRQTLDEPIPMLNDKSPRECAADPSLHKHAVQWLKYLENQAAGVASQPYDFSWIWKELDLEKYR